MKKKVGIVTVSIIVGFLIAGVLMKVGETSVRAETKRLYPFKFEKYPGQYENICNCFELVLEKKNILNKGGLTFIQIDSIDKLYELRIRFYDTLMFNFKQELKDAKKDEKQYKYKAISKECPAFEAYKALK